MDSGIPLGIASFATVKRAQQAFMVPSDLLGSRSVPDEELTERVRDRHIQGMIAHRAYRLGGHLDPASVGLVAGRNLAQAWARPQRDQSVMERGDRADPLPPSVFKRQDLRMVGRSSHELHEFHQFGRWQTRFRVSSWHSWRFSNFSA